MPSDFGISLISFLRDYARLKITLSNFLGKNYSLPNELEGVFRKVTSPLTFWARPQSLALPKSQPKSILPKKVARNS